ncbi:hypothetical protein [Pyramidobacter piscolens]|uniref:hypothetical protein n=1 Tax=Pyramidobacter piscolens TaxID=638849 RepID=UPI001FCBEE50|nr:hypothetical protein [Pyramidobacter piscolens]
MALSFAAAPRFLRLGRRRGIFNDAFSLKISLNAASLIENAHYSGFIILVIALPPEGMILYILSK